MLVWVLILFAATSCYGSMITATDRLFLLKDVDRDGQISHFEIRHYLDACDTGGDSRITEAEFFLCSTGRNPDMQPFAVSLFHAFDVDQKYWISLNDNVMDKIIKVFDNDNNGSISKAEFEFYLHQRLHHHQLSVTK